MPLYYHHLYTDGIHPEARFPRDRYRAIRERLEARSIDLRIATAPLGQRSDILLAHDEDYVNRFLDGNMSIAERRRIGLRPWTPMLIPRTLRIVGGAVQALTDAAESGGFAANMAGGTHHAHHAWGSGYCVFNDIAICARIAHRRMDFERVLVVDLDVHQGDGTASILLNDSQIDTLSVHCAENFPFRKTTSTWDIPIPQGSGDREYLAAVEHGLDLGFAKKPSLILFQAGVDALEADALGRLGVSRMAMRKRNQLVFEFCQAHRIPCVVFMGGGYSSPIDDTVDAFVDLFQQAAAAHSRAISARIDKVIS